MSLEEELEMAFAKVIQKEKLTIHLQSLKEQLPLKQIQLQELEESVYKEQRDVEKLESLNIASLFYQILGNKKQQLEKERQEYLAAFLQYENNKRALEAIEYEIEIVEEKLSALYRSEYYFDSLLKKKERKLRIENPNIARQIIDIDHNLMGHRSRIHEIKEALSKLTQSEELIEELQIELSKVKHWGSYEYSGTGKYSTYKKKSYIQLGRAQVEKVSFALNTLQDELYDISHHLKIDYSRYLDTFHHFLVDFYDGMISDWVVLGQIKISQNELEALRSKLIRLRATLDYELEKTNNYIEKQQQQRNELIRTT